MEDGQIEICSAVISFTMSSLFKKKKEKKKKLWFKKELSKIFFLHEIMKYWPERYEVSQRVTK